jgi:hypothetical protein
VSPIVALLPHRAPVTPPAAVIERAPLNVLCRGEWSANIFARGGHIGGATLGFSQIQGERVRGQTGTATLTIPAAVQKACEPLLVAIAQHPWDYELHLYRGTRRVWLGPVTKLTFPEGSGDVQLQASDLTVWAQVRELTRTVWYEADIAEVWAQLFEEGMLPDLSPNVTVAWAPTGQTQRQTYYAGTGGPGRLVAPLLDDLTRLGVQSLALERTIYVGPAAPIPTRRILLTDEHFATRPGVVVDALLQRNRLIIAGGAASETSDPIKITVEDKAAQIVDGLLVDVVRDPAIVTDEAALERGRRRLALSTSAPVQFSGGTLDQAAPILFDELVPGAIYDVALNDTIAPVAGSFELVRVPFTVTRETESIGIEVQPAEAA